MIFDFTLLLIFLGSLTLLWQVVSQKIPQLVAIPDHVIITRLHEDSAKYRLFLLQLKTFYIEQKYKEVFWRFAGKVLYKVHLYLLRIDNKIDLVLKKVRAKGIVLNGFGNSANPVVKQAPSIDQRGDSGLRRVKTHRIEEVRQKIHT